VNLVSKRLNFISIFIFSYQILAFSGPIDTILAMPSDQKSPSIWDTVEQVRKEVSEWPQWKKEYAAAYDPIRPQNHYLMRENAEKQDKPEKLSVSLIMYDSSVPRARVGNLQKILSWLFLLVNAPPVVGTVVGGAELVIKQLTRVWNIGIDARAFCE
jgi:hypothetical protein